MAPDQADQRTGQFSTWISGVVIFSLVIWLTLLIPRAIILMIAYEVKNAGDKSIIVNTADDCNGGLRHQTQGECLVGFSKHENYQSVRTMIITGQYLVSVTAAIILASLVKTEDSN
ncbi:hypothetical protein [Nodosilinea sp. FACHB-13]|uniref:hypothetical protein n=1 Tax=Cyanophyceae TaxID=3028117 RepID=UPI0016883652|nr:hypothetical protein [Nodosilinea sp. FACHB-13]